MSAAKQIYNYEQEMMHEVQNVQELMSRSPTGRVMMEASIRMAGTEDMKQLMVLIGDPRVHEDERMLLAQYMGEMLKRDPLRGMKLYADYLRNVAGKPEYAAKRDYYLAISDAAMDVDATIEYREYIESYRKFEVDKSPEAVAARQATEVMQDKMKAWAEE